MSPTFTDPVDCYQAMGIALANAATEPWDRIVVDAVRDESSVDMTIACFRGPEPAPSAWLSVVPRLGTYISQLAWLVSSEDKGLFRRCLFTLHKTGKFDVKFEY